MMKICCHCKETKEIGAFSRAKNRKDGLYPACKECRKAERAAKADKGRDYSRRYYAEHAEERRSYALRYRAENPAKAQASQVRFRQSQKYREARERNRETIRARSDQWRKAHRSYDVAWQTQYRERIRTNDPELWRARQRRYMAAWLSRNPGKRQEHSQKRRARLRGSIHNFTAMEWRLCKARYNYTCLCCGEREPVITLTVDHVIPVARGGTNDIANIQPLCMGCNTRKGTKNIDYRPQ